jgi:hypothetical protein
MHLKRIDGRFEVWGEVEYPSNAPPPPTPGERLVATFGREADAEDFLDQHTLIMKQGTLLSQAVNLIRGPAPDLVSWSHHDIVELVAGIMQQNTRLGLLAKMQQAMCELLATMSEDTRRVLESIEIQDSRQERASDRES